MLGDFFWIPTGIYVGYCNIYICWITCSPTYMKCYPTYIGSQKCYPTYMTSYMLDNNVGFWPDIYVGQHHDICWVTVCILGINYDICWIYMLGYICWTHRLYMLDIIEYMLDNISGKWVHNIYVMLPNIYRVSARNVTQHLWLHISLCWTTMWGFDLIYMLYNMKIYVGWPYMYWESTTIYVGHIC